MPRRTMISRFAVAAAVLCCAASGVALAGLDPESNTDGFDPGVEAHRLGEARRLNAMARQLDLVYRMQWENPYFAGDGPIRQPIGYESKQVAPNRWIYRPIYPEDVAPAVDESPVPETLPQPLPPHAAGKKPPAAPAPAGAAPEDLIPPQPAKPAPREF